MKVSPYIYAIGAAVAWGMVYTIDQRLLKDLSPITLMLINSLVTSAVLIPFAYLQRTAIAESIAATPLRVWSLVIMTLLFTILANFLIYSSIKYLGASTAAVFEIAYPFFVILFTYLLFGGTLSTSFLVGAVFIFIGSAIIVTQS